MPHSASPTWNHPLFGADPGTLLRAFASNGPLPVKVWPLAGALLAASLLRGPVTLCERGLAGYRLGKAPPPRAPVFILGHWRSGTTHLFNLLSRDPRFAWADPYTTGMPWDFLILGRLLRPLLERALPPDRFIDNIPVTPDSPQEDEIGLASMQNLSYYHGIYFPRRFALRYRQGVLLEELGRREMDRWRRRFDHYNRKLLLRAPGRTLLVKNPVYTARVAVIREVYPDARFIHIHRNPYLVYESTRKFHRALLPRFALQGFDDDTADELILDTYPRMIDKLYRDVSNLEPGRFVELGFDDLERDPLDGLKRVYESLNLTGFAEMRGVFREYLDSVSDYRKSVHRLGDEVIQCVDRHWGELVRRWGYGTPR